MGQGFGGVPQGSIKVLAVSLSRSKGRLFSRSHAPGYAAYGLALLLFDTLLYWLTETQRTGVDRLRTANRILQCDRRLRWPMAIVLFGALISVQRSAASEIDSAEVGQNTAHHCKCGTRCRGASCCCGPRKRPAATEAPVQKAAGSRSDGLATSSPCSVGSAPCGDSGLPSSTVSGPETKNASITTSVDLVLPAAGILRASDYRMTAPPRRPSRLDRPPDGDIA